MKALILLLLPLLLSSAPTQTAQVTNASLFPRLATPPLSATVRRICSPRPRSLANPFNTVDPALCTFTADTWPRRRSVWKVVPLAPSTLHLRPLPGTGTTLTAPLTRALFTWPARPARCAAGARPRTHALRVRLAAHGLTSVTRLRSALTRAQWLLRHRLW